MTADDLGLCPAVTDGILDACRHGIVRAASLFVPGEDAARAASLARREAGLSVGVHLALIDGRPLLPAAQVRSLLGDAQGAFPSDYRAFLRRYITRKVDLKQVYREWRAQIEQAIAWGITPAHLDSHQHLHLLPGLFELTLRLCQELKMPRLRVPFSGLPTSLRDLRGCLGPGAAALELLSLRAKKILRNYPDIKSCEYFLGRAQSCRLSLPALLMLIDKVSHGTYELLCHPGRPDPDALRRHAFGVNWGQELSALTSAAARARLDARGIVLMGSL